MPLITIAKAIFPYAIKSTHNNGLNWTTGSDCQVKGAFFERFQF